TGVAESTERASAPDGIDGVGLRVGVVRARWNAGVVERLADGVEGGLKAMGVVADDITEVSVPGSFEIPFGARALAASGKVDGVVCSGSALRGGTPATTTSGRGSAPAASRTSS